MQFFSSNKDNADYTSYKDYYKHWCNKLRCMGMDNRYFMKYIIRNMPSGIKNLANPWKVQILKQLNEIVASFEDEDLYWQEKFKHDRYQRRKEAKKIES